MTRLNCAVAKTLTEAMRSNGEIWVESYCVSLISRTLLIATAVCEASDWMRISFPRERGITSSSR